MYSQGWLEAMVRGEGGSSPGGPAGGGRGFGFHCILFYVHEKVFF